MFKMKKNFKSFCFLTEPVTGNNNRQLLSGIDKIIRQLDQLKIDVQLDDPNIASTKTNTDTIKADVATIKTTANSTKTNTDTIKSDVSNIKTKTADIYTLLDNRLVEKQWITRADYDALVLAGEVDPEVLYIVIESQSNS